MDTITLENLQARFNSHGAALTGNDVLKWNATTKRFEPTAVKTINGTSLLGSGDCAISGGGIDRIADIKSAVNGVLILTESGRVFFTNSETDGQPIAGASQTSTRANGFAAGLANPPRGYFC